MRRICPEKLPRASQARIDLQSKHGRTMTNERNIRRTELPNGLIVLTERMEYMLSLIHI